MCFLIVWLVGLARSNFSVYYLYFISFFIFLITISAFLWRYFLFTIYSIFGHRICKLEFLFSPMLSIICKHMHGVPWSIISCSCDSQPCPWSFLAASAAFLWWPSRAMWYRSCLVYLYTVLSWLAFARIATFVAKIALWHSIIFGCSR